MGLQRFTIKDIEIRLAAIIHEQAIQREQNPDLLVEIMELEAQEETLWAAWHRARKNNGNVRI